MPIYKNTVSVTDSRYHILYFLGWLFWFYVNGWRGDYYFAFCEKCSALVEGNGAYMSDDVGEFAGYWVKAKMAFRIFWLTHGILSIMVDFNGFVTIIEELIVNQPFTTLSSHDHYPLIPKIYSHKHLLIQNQLPLS